MPFHFHGGRSLAHNFLLKYICYTDYGKLPILQNKAMKLQIIRKKQKIYNYSKSADLAAHFVKSAELSKQADTFRRT